MVGGKVYSWIVEPEFVRITVRGTGVEKNDLLDVKVKISADNQLLKKGESIWWQGFRCMIGPNDEIFEKVGFSGNHRHIKDNHTWKT